MATVWLLPFTWDERHPRVPTGASMITVRPTFVVS
jgi:hypothetical protein